MTAFRCIYIKRARLNIKIHFLSVISVLALIFADSSIYSFAVLFCAAFHELGHYLMIRKSGAEVCELYFLPFGTEMRVCGELAYSSEIAVAAAGPFFSFALALISGVFFAFFNSPILLFCGMCSAFMMLINLVPVRGFDGGRIVRCVILSHTEYEKALKMIHISELLSLILLSLFSAAAVIFFSFNISLIVICLYLFFSVYRKEY